MYIYFRAYSKLLLVFTLFTFSFGFRFPFGNSKKIGKTNELDPTKLYFSNEKIGQDGRVYINFRDMDDYFGVTGSVPIENLPSLNRAATVDEETYYVIMEMLQLPNNVLFQSFLYMEELITVLLPENVSKCAVSNVDFESLLVGYDEGLFGSLDEIQIDDLLIRFGPVQYFYSYYDYEFGLLLGQKKEDRAPIALSMKS
ncbi:MAG: hypothetical protein EZS28_006814 [Streblomastix strix]|uniref:Uncharacterized protein n=1 Tax=Streblomastix strix TaxID=222440 RepID=A0A5J4WRW7_9EUKA|nr:MAG: hypothetical protein EZS28_006814 [Streblomastix strix]